MIPLLVAVAVLTALLGLAMTPIGLLGPGLLLMAIMGLLLALLKQGDMRRPGK